MVALKQKKFEIQWFDKRNGFYFFKKKKNVNIKDLQQINLNQFYGIICNITMKKFFSLYTSKHWFSFKKIQVIIYLI